VSPRKNVLAERSLDDNAICKTFDPWSRAFSSRTLALANAWGHYGVCGGAANDDKGRCTWPVIADHGVTFNYRQLRPDTRKENEDAADVAKSS
jgi:hypothetical protein